MTTMEELLVKYVYNNAEKNNLLKPGTVVADNVIYFKINDFLDHLNTSGKYTDFEIFKTFLEYDKIKKNGLSVAVFK